MEKRKGRKEYSSEESKIFFVTMSLDYNFDCQQPTLTPATTTTIATRPILSDSALIIIYKHGILSDNVLVASLKGKELPKIIEHVLKLSSGKLK